MFFCAKNDARENCQREKVLSLFQIQIHQFQKMSLPKITKKWKNPTGNGKHFPIFGIRIHKNIKNLKKQSNAGFSL